METCRNSSLDSVMKSVTTGHIDMRAAPIQGLSPAGLHFLKRLLRRDPVLRISAEDALEHDFFQQHLAAEAAYRDRENDAADANRIVAASQDRLASPKSQCSLLRYLKFCEECSLEN